MEGEFVKLLNGININLGLLVIIILGGGGILAVIYKSYKKYESYIATKVKKEEDEEVFKSSLSSMVETVNKIQQKLEENEIENRKDKEETLKRFDLLQKAIDDSRIRSDEGDQKLAEQIKSYENEMNYMNKKLDAIDNNNKLLIESDKESIKANITEKYYESKDQGYIYIHTLQSLECLYDKYLQENGNTFVGQMMIELRSLPHNIEEANGELAIEKPKRRTSRKKATVQDESK